VNIGDWYINQTLNDPLLRQIRDKLKDKTVCVMGACGQVGSHTITKLYEFGFPAGNIYINDNLSLGLRHNLPNPLRDQVDTRPHHIFASNPPFHPDILLFVGGRSSAPHFDGLKDFEEEIRDWRIILEWCVDRKIRLIFASTSSLCKERPSKENQLAWAGSDYELTKLAMENMAIKQALCEELIIQICRFFSVYGVTEQHKGNFGNLYTQILWHAREGKPFELWGEKGKFAPGEQTRDTIFAVEVSRAILFLLTLPDPNPTLHNISELIYNIGQGKPVTVREMTHQVGELLDIEPSVIENEDGASRTKNYVVHTHGDPTKLINAGFKPMFTNHINNLQFINQALSDLSWYWSIVEQIRISTMNHTS